MATIEEANLSALTVDEAMRSLYSYEDKLKRYDDHSGIANVFSTKMQLSKDNSNCKESNSRNTNGYNQKGHGGNPCHEK